MSNISAKIIGHSKNASTGEELKTFEIEMPRIILAELNTHKILNRNVQSCLSGDTDITFDLPGQLAVGKKRQHTKKLKDLFVSWDTGPMWKNRAKATIDFSMVDPDVVYREKELSRLVFSEATRLRAIRISETTPVFEKDGGFYYDGKAFIEWCISRNQAPALISPMGNVKKRISEMKIRTLNEDTKDLINSKIVDIFHSGTKEVYEITLEKGYVLKCSKEHRLFTNKGWMTLEDMNIRRIENDVSCAIDKGIEIYTNGEECYKSKEWLESQRDQGKTLRQIAQEIGVNEKTVRYFSEKVGAKFSKKQNIENENLQYKNENWLREQREAGLTCGRIAELCNTTEDRVKKSCKKHKISGMTGIILEGGTTRVSWNTGKTYEMSEAGKEAIRISGENRKKKHQENRVYEAKDGARKEFANDIISFLNANRKETMEKAGWKCAVTGESSALEMHHIDPVWHNKERVFDLSNIIVLTKKVHRAIHNKNLDLVFLEWVDSGKPVCDFPYLEEERRVLAEKKKNFSKKLVGVARKIISVKYAGEEEVYDIEVEGPYHNFIANGFVVHNSRAVPVKSAVENAKENFFVPTFWGKNQAGMQATEECNNPVIVPDVGEMSRDNAWIYFRDLYSSAAKAFADAGYHKQISNRLNESHMMIRAVVGGVDLDNLFNLRIHPAAQPEFRDLAIKIYRSLKESTPFVLQAGEWHLPYIDLSRDSDGKIVYSKDGIVYDLEEARQISLSCVAQVSYRKLDDSLTKAEDITGKLFNADVVHASPAEHLGTPIIPYLEGTKNVPIRFESWEQGITSVDRQGRFWSGNLRGFIQYRQLIPNNTVWEFTDEKFAEYTKDLNLGI